MLKHTACLFLSFLICAAGYCQSKAINPSAIITSITGRDTIQYLYQYNTAGDALNVYKVEQGVISGTMYRLTTTPKGLLLYSKPLQAGQLLPDSLAITFNDAQSTVIIAKHNQYTLFPAYYPLFKTALKDKYNINTLLQLLSEPVGDYPLDDLIPLLTFTTPTSKQVKIAKTTTQRSQADIEDSWTVRYYYKQHRLDSISASNAEEIRFTKRLTYGTQKNTIRTFLNVEDRQITTTSITYKPGDTKQRRIHRLVVETGKNRETEIVTYLTRRNLGALPDKELSTTEILDLLKR